MDLPVVVIRGGSGRDDDKHAQTEAPYSFGQITVESIP